MFGLVWLAFDVVGGLNAFEMSLWGLLYKACLFAWTLCFGRLLRGFAVAMSGSLLYGCYVFVSADLWVPLVALWLLELFVVVFGCFADDSLVGCFIIPITLGVIHCLTVGLYCLVM